MQQTTINDRYAIEDLLGDGGMARVYLARDSVLERAVALKILREPFADNEEFVGRFQREARSAASLSHPNLVQVYDHGRAGDGSYYIAMEHVPGGTLKERIARHGPLPPGEAVRISLQVAEALSAAHGRGIVHRDIKPQNILLTESGDAKVADFGIARAISSSTLSGTSMVLGTAGYMSPEQAMGQRVGPRSDLYSLGIVVYEMLTGELPFDADTPVAVAIKHLQEPPRHPREANPGVSEELDALTTRLLAKDPEDRYASAAELVRELKLIRDGKNVAPAGAKTRKHYRSRTGAADDAPTVVAPGARRTSHRRRRNMGRYAVAVLLILVISGAAAWTVAQAPWSPNESLAQVSAEPLRSQVPEVVGLSEEEARKRLSAAAFQVEVNTRESSREDSGMVMEQSIKAGAQVKEGSTVELVVGEGPSVVEVPDLIYLSAARDQLAEAGLELGSVTEAPSESVTVGVISSQSPAEGEKVEPGTKVDVTVSTGPEPAPAASGAPTPQQQAPQPAPPQEVSPPVQRPEPGPQPEARHSAPQRSEPAPQQGRPSGNSASEQAGARKPQGPRSGGEIVDSVFDDVGIGD